MSCQCPVCSLPWTKLAVALCTGCSHQSTGRGYAAPDATLKTLAVPLLIGDCPSSPSSCAPNHCKHPQLQYMSTVLSINALMSVAQCEVHLSLSGTIRRKFSMSPARLAESAEALSHAPTIVVMECEKGERYRPVADAKATLYMGRKTRSFLGMSAEDSEVKISGVSAILDVLCTGRTANLWVWDKCLVDSHQIPHCTTGARLIVDMEDDCKPAQHLALSTTTSYVPFLFQAEGLCRGVSLHTRIIGAFTRLSDSDSAEPMLRTAICEVLSSQSAEGRCFCCQMCLNILRSLCSGKTSRRSLGKRESARTLVTAKLGDEFS